MENRYSKFYSEKSLWGKITTFSKKAGLKVIYAVLLLYYVMADKNVDLKTKAIVIGALGYFIFPLDAISDLIPLTGFTDDLGVLLYALSQISDSITPEIREKAQVKLKDWFQKVDKKELKELEGKIG